jgi:hypothetical protein
VPLNLLTDPTKTVNGFASTCISITQVLYTMRREDYEVESLLASSDSIVLPASLGDVSSEFTAGDKLYYDDLDQVLTVESVSFPSTKTVIVVVEDVLNTGAAGYINNLTARSGYRLQIRLSEFDDQLLYFLPDYKGDIYCELSGILKFLLPFDGLEIQPYYQEVWASGSETEAQFSDALFISWARKQILSSGGANTGDLVLKTTGALGKNLSLFDEFLTNFPKTWKNWSRFVSYLNQSYASVNIIQEFRDINNTFSSSISNIVLTPTAPNIIKQELEAAENASTTEYYLQVYPGSPVTQAAQYSYYQIEEECKNPIMIEWLNRNGAYDSYLFNIDQSVQDIADEGLSWESPINGDIETITQTKYRTVEKHTQVLVLKAIRLSRIDLQALHDIKQSNDVRVWLAKDASSYVNVIVNNGYADDFTTGKANYEFTLSIEFPSNFDFFTAKEY